MIMKKAEKTILTINAGSSSIKFALYNSEMPLTLLYSGQWERVGSKNSILSYFDGITNKGNSVSMDTSEPNMAANILIDWLVLQKNFNSVEAIGHRIVHGMKHTHSETLTDEVLAELKTISGYDPEHLPEEINLVEIFKKRYPEMPQIACFDTSFHTTMPTVAKLLPIPRRIMKLGIQRYGFHGISYAYLINELGTIAGKEISLGKVILAHLGNGASLCAVKEGKSLDTSMGFTPSSGIPMGTRTGDMDPGVIWYLMQVEKITPKEFSHLINHESGMLGVSETSSDMRDLLGSRTTDSRAAEAVELFCYQIKKCIGSYAAVLQGLDTLVFSGGIGEHAHEIREEICRGLQFLGIELNEARNKNNEAVISADNSKVVVRVIQTNEQLMMARSVCEELNHSTKI
jgi:acetate kinase